jgi:pyruvate formate lyase activating enzyme
MIRSRSPTITSENLSGSILSDPGYTCLCWFGGCPSSQPEFVLSVSRHISERRGDRVLRICLETNGNMDPGFLKPISEISLESGGGLKFDLKFHSRDLNKGICGASNDQAIRNFQSLAALNSDRRNPPFLRASTLLLPGYVDAEEITGIANTIAEVDPTIPYSLLAFHPDYVLSDLPRPTSRYVEECVQAARSAGLTRINVGNRFLITRQS